MGSYQNKVAVVTGGARGIGQAIVRALVREGAAVIAADVDEDGLFALGQELGEQCVGVRADVTRVDDMKHIVIRAVREFGGLNVAFNVAGIARTHSLLNITDEDWDRTMNTCLKGVLYATQQEARQMVHAKAGGSIVNVASLNSKVPMRGGAAYCAAKAGVVMLSRCAALELAEYSIRVNALSPGLVETPGTRPIFDNEHARSKLLERIPAGRAASPDEIADAALFLGGPQSTYVNGANLFVDAAWAHTAYPDLRPSALR